MTALARKVRRETTARRSTVAGRSERCWGAHPLHALWPVSPGRLAFYLDQLGDLLNAGVTAHEAMTQLAMFALDGRLRRMSRELATGASQGEALAEGLRRYPQLMPPFVRGLILAGERSGQLPDVCHELATELRDLQKLRWVQAFAAVWFGGLLVMVLSFPPLTGGILAASVEAMNSGRELPAAPLARLLEIAGPVVRQWSAQVALPALLVVIALAAAGRIAGAWPALQAPLQRVLYRLPVTGNLLRRSAMPRLLLALEALLRAGVNMDEALTLAGEATGSVVMTEQLAAAGAQARRGVALPQALAPVTCLPREVKDSLTIGERAGAYERTLQALRQGSRDAKAMAVRVVGVAGYGVGLVGSAVAVGVAVFIMYRNYVMTALSAFDSP